MDLLAVQGTLKSLLQHHSSKASILRHSAFFTVQLSHPYMTTGKTIALIRRTFVGKVMSLLLSAFAGPYFPLKSLPAISRGLQGYFSWHSRNCPLTFSCSEPCVDTPSHRPFNFPGTSSSPLSQRLHISSLHFLCGSQDIFGWMA